MTGSQDSELQLSMPQSRGIGIAGGLSEQATAEMMND